MPIPALQQAAFQRSPEFNGQVETIVRETARYRLKPPDPLPKPSEAVKQVYTQVIRDPSRYGFVPAIVADAGWVITYDAWSVDPGGSDGAIEAGVQAIWYEYLQIPEPEA